MLAIRSVQSRLVILLALAPVLGSPQADAPAAFESALRVESLPPRLREAARALLDEKDDQHRALLTQQFAGQHSEEAAGFLLALLEHDHAAPVRCVIVDALGMHDSAEVRSVLERHAASDPDAAVAVRALDRLRGIEARPMRQVLRRRIEKARHDGDREALDLLYAEEERWISVVRGVMLPAFLREVPPQFSVSTSEHLRVLVFGDFGCGSPEQRQVADAMQAYHHRAPFDFGITLGDNFYTEGMTSVDDPRWQTWWEQMYAPLGIPIYASLGNHDWDGADSPAAEILYSQRSKSWRLPAPYYTFTAGPAQFFAIDTNEISTAQREWLTRELDHSPARWKIAYGHHPIYDASRENGYLITTLMPVLKGRADVYFAGHYHNLQHVKPQEGVQLFISGGGGRSVGPPQSGPRSLFALGAFGFTALEITPAEIGVRFVGPDLRTLYEYRLTK